jgi:hypothetical protein
MVLIHLLSNHFLRRSMSRLSRIGAAYAAVGAVSWGTSPGTPDPDSSLRTTSICMHRLVFYLTYVSVFQYVQSEPKIPL